MSNKENTFESNIDFSPATEKSNPFLSLLSNNEWESPWDQSLKSLVIECSFDFSKISSSMNQMYKTTAFSQKTCQKRWSMLHKQRKQKKIPQESNKEKTERIMKISAPSGSGQRMTLQELSESLPVTRTKKDFLDPTFKEFDKETDQIITGETITPSGNFFIIERVVNDVRV